MHSWEFSFLAGGYLVAKYDVKYQRGRKHSSPTIWSLFECFKLMILHLGIRQVHYKLRSLAFQVLVGKDDINAG